jgi:CRP-like cAMP-binding protein
VIDKAALNRRRMHAEQQRKAFVESLDRQQLEQRIMSLAADGLTEHDIGELVGLHVEQVRRLLGERQEQRA